MRQAVARSFGLGPLFVASLGVRAMVGDPYGVLGVDRSTSPEEIRAAYLRLARRFHPDLNRGDPAGEERLKAINVAYELLADPLKRAAYDRAWAERHRPPPPPPPPPNAPGPGPARRGPRRTAASGEPPPSEQQAPRRLRWDTAIPSLLAVMVLCAFLAWLGDDDEPRAQSVVSSSRRSPTATAAPRRTPTRMPTRVPTRTPTARPVASSGRCAGWEDWVVVMGIIDARYQSTYDAMATVAYPTSGQWWTWSQAVGHQTNEIWALTPPPAAQAYQDNLVEMLRPLSRAMGAYADGDYAYGDSLWSEYRALYRVGTTHLDRANGECASPS